MNGAIFFKCWKKRVIILGDFQFHDIIFEIIFIHVLVIVCAAKRFSILRTCRHSAIGSGIELFENLFMNN